MTSHELAFNVLRAGLLLSLILGIFLIVHLYRRRYVGLAAVECGQHILTAFLTLASAILLYAFIAHDFSNAYVYSYSDRTLPFLYRITAFWGGQDGSVLFWAWSVAISGSIFALTPAYRRLTNETRLWFWLFFLGIMGFFLLLLTAWSNPFMMLSPVPPDGKGLNPLLQNPGMILHPPLLFLGYGGFTIPACLGLAQQLTQNRNHEGPWISVTRPITLGAWMLLTAGILLGGWWDYMELGWGGYWAWDPVENASLIPWLVSTAFLHTSVVEVRRGKLYRTNVFLISLTTLAAFFATYLVRSGIVQSVHAFGSTGISLPLMLFMLLLLLTTIMVVSGRQSTPGKELSSIDSREGFLLIVAWAFLALSVIVLVSTIWPVLRSLIIWLPTWVSVLPGQRFFFIVLILALCVVLSELIVWKIRRADENAGVKIHDTSAFRVLTVVFGLVLIFFILADLSGASAAARKLFSQGALLSFGESVKAIGGKVFEPSFYNRVCLPLFVFIGLLLCLCPWQRWKGGMRSSRVTKIVVALLILAAVVIWYTRRDLLFQAAGIPDDAQMAELVKDNPLAADEFRQAYRQTSALAVVAALGGAVALAGLVSLLLQIFIDPGARRERRSRTAWVAHLGLATLLLGVAFSGPYMREKEGALSLGANGADSLDLAGYTVRLERLEDIASIIQTPGSDPVALPRAQVPPEYFMPFAEESGRLHYESLRAVLKVTRDGKDVGTLTPERRRYPKYGDQRFTEASTSFSMGDELYATLSGIESGPSGEKAHILVSVHPLVNWVWLGGAIMCLAPLLAWPSFLKRRTAGSAEPGDSSKDATPEDAPEAG